GSVRSAIVDLSGEAGRDRHGREAAAVDVGPEARTAVVLRWLAGGREDRGRDISSRIDDGIEVIFGETLKHGRLRGEAVLKCCSAVESQVLVGVRETALPIRKRRVAPEIRLRIKIGEGTDLRVSS